jgi:rhamnose utilization protein RhaD (predicted bifunctional aldolase and dehydrogenase)
MSKEIVAVVDELVEILTQYSARLGADVEMVVETGGECSIRVADMDEGSFQEVVRFNDFAGLMRFLETGKL